MKDLGLDQSLRMGLGTGAARSLQENAWRAGFERYGRFSARVFPVRGLRASGDAERLPSRQWACSQVSTPSNQ